MLCSLTNFYLMVFSPAGGYRGWYTWFLILQILSGCRRWHSCFRPPQVVSCFRPPQVVSCFCVDNLLSSLISGCPAPSWLSPSVQLVSARYFSGGAAIARCPLSFSFPRWHVPWNRFSCSPASLGFSQSYQPCVRWNILACFVSKVNFSLNFFILLANLSYAISPNLPFSTRNLKNLKILLVA